MADSMPTISSLVSIVATIAVALTSMFASLLTVSTSSLISSGAISRQKSYLVSEPSRNLMVQYWKSLKLQIYMLSVSFCFLWCNTLSYIHYNPWLSTSFCAHISTCFIALKFQWTNSFFYEVNRSAHSVPWESN